MNAAVRTIERSPIEYLQSMQAVPRALWSHVKQMFHSRVDLLLLASGETAAKGFEFFDRYTNLKQLANFPSTCIRRQAADELQFLQLIKHCDQSLTHTNLV